MILILSIAIVFDLTEKLDRFYDNQAPLKEIVFDYYVNFVPYYMNMFSSLFTFISVIFFTSKMANDTEIIAMLSSGISFNRIMWPYFVSAAVIALISFGLGGYVIPNSTRIMMEFENKYVSKYTKENARDVQMEVEEGVILYVERYDISTNKGYRLSLEKFEGKHLNSRLTAEAVTWDSAYNWTLYNYLQRDFDGMYEYIEQGEKLDTIIPVQPDEFFVTAQLAPQMNNFKLKEYLNKQKKRGVGNIQAFEDEYYRRFSYPFASFIMTLIGISLSSRKVKGGMGLNLGIGLGLSAFYILFQTMSTSFSVNGSMSPLMSAWLPNLVFLAIGVFLYFRAPK